MTCPDNQQSAAVGIDVNAMRPRQESTAFLIYACLTVRAGLNARIAASRVFPRRFKQRRQTKQGGTKQIYHLPILFCGICRLGAGSHLAFAIYVPRAVDNAAGLTHAQVKQMVWWLSPHLLTAAVCLLFAYEVAWLLVVGHRKGVFHGALMALLLCGALVAASWYGIARLPHDLLVIEAGYIVLAALTMGAIVGGLQNRLCADAARPSPAT